MASSASCLALMETPSGYRDGLSGFEGERLLQLGQWSLIYFLKRYHELFFFWTRNLGTLVESCWDSRGNRSKSACLRQKNFPYKQQPDQDKLYFSWPLFNNLNQIKSFPANYWLFWLNIKLKPLYLAAGNEQFSRHLWRASWFFQSKSALN